MKRTKKVGRGKAKVARRAKKPAEKTAPADIGRPTVYESAFADQARKLCQLGATDVDLADFFEVSINTIGNWKTRYPEFLGSLKAGKDHADARVERSLYQRAVGYTFDSVKIFLPKDSREPVLVPHREHVPPDVTAQIFWLKNRRKDEWRDRHEMDLANKLGPDGKPIPIEVSWKAS